MPPAHLGSRNKAFSACAAGFVFGPPGQSHLTRFPRFVGPAFGCYSFTLRRPGSAPPREESEKAGFAWLCFFAFLARPARRDQPPLSGGRMESAWRGASGMDAARGVKGHGWPLYAGPRSDDGTREVERSETRMAGAKRFCLLFSRLKKVSRPAGRNLALKRLGKRHPSKTLSQHPPAISNSQRTPERYARLNYRHSASPVPAAVARQTGA